VIDGDGLFLIASKPDIIKGYSKAILTPNIVEYKRLYESVLTSHPNKKEEIEKMEEKSSIQFLAKEMGQVTIVRKGNVDLISDGSEVLSCEESGSNRRASGQGDILAGSIGTFLIWGLISKDLPKDFSPTLLSCYAGCYFTRHCNFQAFQIFKRSMTTTDMLAQIGSVMQQLFPTD